ncbi:MAG: 30S ribosomal protein S3ae [Candidatus Bathyarchaeia archaeon]
MPKPSKKVKDKWRMKKWFNVAAPACFGELNIASIPCDDENKLIGRVVESTLYDITGDFSHQTIKLYFLITKLEGVKAKTIMKGHEYSSDYLRSLIRRGTSRVDGIFNVTTKDGFSSRVSIVAFSKSRLKTSQKKAIREVMKSVIEEKAKNLNYEQLCQEMVLGKIGSEVYNLAKKICQLRHVGVRKSKLLSMPQKPTEKIEVEVKEAAPT